MKIGDIVRWTRFDGDEDLYKILKEPPSRLNDIGIVLSIDTWDELETQPETIVIEVYFMKLGLIWCNPSSLQVVSSADE